MNADERYQFLKDTIEKTINPRVEYEINPSEIPDDDSVRVTISFDDYHVRFSFSNWIVSTDGGSAEYIKYGVMSAIHRLAEIYFLNEDAG